MSDLMLEIGTIVSIQKTELDNLFSQLVKMGYEVIGPKAKDQTIVHSPIKSAAELPLGYSSSQEPGAQPKSRTISPFLIKLYLR